MAVHPTAIIDPRAEVATDAEIGAYTVVGPWSVIGPRVRLGPHVVVVSHTRIGEGTQVHPHAVLGDAPQDLAFEDRQSWVDIGRNVVIREGVTIHRGTKADSTTLVGDGCFLMANSHVAHNVVLGHRVILANGALLAGYVEVGPGAFISGNAVVHQFCRIGRLAMISGGSAISQDVAPFCTTYSASRNRLAGLNVVGMRRAGFSAEERLQVRRAFRLLFREGLSPSEAVARIRAELPAGPAWEMADFAAASKRGLVSFAPGPMGEGEDE
ncbi:MAG: acyl-ACP--UDP-N-acetylglucosamine O-acyltransferase [Kiritimatiellae bacterium]|nr:acyl-ACP--UDP-N-acetylglucosamine O-acyltransferase [Kiritimatiellia bacterium]MDW8459104.1 acyl-ACP--UDP-N-acetylglucosamine O-acyltransferase [Verrucomicrobiota bacterium]